MFVSKGHAIECQKVTETEERKKILGQKRLCFNCTGAKHRAVDCKSKTGCLRCSQRHHTSLCDKGEQLLTATGTNNRSVVYPVVIVQVEGVKCRALLDTGAGSSYASAALLDRVPKRQRITQVRRIEMMYGATTKEVEIATIKVKVGSKETT